MKDMEIRRYFPGFKDRAFVLSYDDGVEQDERLVSLLNRYGLKGTFNLNSGLMKSGFTWEHECGMTVRRLPLSAAATVYVGHEVAAHSYTHPYLHLLPRDKVLGELAQDKAELEAATGRAVRGFAIPFTDYNDIIRSCAAECGFDYVRISVESGSYVPERDFLALRAGAFHFMPGFDGFTDGFLGTDVELATCMIAGHSYDLDVYSLWDKTEALFERVSSRADVLSMTVIDYVDYIRAANALDLSGGEVINRGNVPVYVRVDGEERIIYPHEKGK